ncbi:MAG: hypothetical protein V3U98_03960 [Acidobacteriota bacterium]
MRLTQTRTERSSGAGERARFLRAPLSAALVAAVAFVLGAASAQANDGERIYCAGHGGYYTAAHYRDHDDGYVLLGERGYRFHAHSAYPALAVKHRGTPALFVSGGYFYPLRIGYGPLYEPTGYFEIHGGRFGRTSLGLQIGLHSLPTIGFGFLSYRPAAVHYYPAPRWYYRGPYVTTHYYRAAPHIYMHRYGRPHVSRRHSGYKWFRSRGEKAHWQQHRGRHHRLHRGERQPGRHGKPHATHDQAPRHPRRKALRFD